MVTYVPILKGREGEFRAIEQLPAALAQQLMPIIEVAPTDKGPTKDLYTFCDQVRERLPADVTIGVDVQHLADPTDSIRRPMCTVADELAALVVPMVPVLHSFDSTARAADVRYAADLLGGATVLRWSGGALDLDAAEAEQLLDRLRGQAGLNTEQCHLVLDAFEVRSERDLIRVEPLINKCLSWAHRYSWSSVSVAAGAMPSSLSNLSTNTPTPVPRWDLKLWRRVADLGVQYSDYGIAHPTLTQTNWPPMPSLRYTDDEVWWVYRRPYDTREDGHVMYDICEALVASGHWPAERGDFSWGDREIAARARRVGGPGNPTSWRAWATSHHLAHVVDQLGGSGYADRSGYNS